MITRYVIEYWNTVGKRYEPIYFTSNKENAEKMFDKPFYKRLTRRLIQITEEVLYTEKAKSK